MKKIDIEKLVQWTMREELPRGGSVEASPWEMIMRIGALGMRVDTSRSASDFGIVPGEPHPDALVIGAAIDALDQEARFSDPAEVLGLFGDLAGIAGDAVGSILKASFDQRAIVMSKATLGSRPAWEFERPTPYRVMVPFRDKAGAVRERPMVHGTDAAGDIVYLQPRRGRAAMRDGAYDLALSPRSPLTWGDPSMISIGHARAEYVAWHMALCTLAERLAGALDEFEPIMPSAAARPWITGQTPTSRVLRGDDLSIDEALPLNPKRPAPIRPTPHARHGKARDVLTEKMLSAQS